ncbi:hypothetical protein J2W27_002959 [Variovorax boronicumulans]|uniref:hypothetical protein n=1 Tax=Variovorax boronicumulans TaxID=436515 RepID=UPI00278B438F|nr:hypothetical protein [Variovorax boronicumulans]MDP9910843.1 hypothetical protein [Variovorax boronicumulans]
MTDISKHPLLRQICEVVAAIEACGASPAITRAVTLAHDLLKPVEALADFKASQIGQPDVARGCGSVAHGEPYWLVWRAGREPAFPPKFQHASYASGRTEADLLARENPGAQFVVLETVSAHRAVGIEVVDLRPDRGIPF